MKTIERIIHLVGRFAVGLGIGVALVSAFVIVTTDVGGDVRPAPDEVVHLDPIVVTISAERYAAIAAELHERPAIVQALDRGSSEG